MSELNEFQAVYSRIIYITNAKTQVELASVLGISQSSISDAKRRGSVPADWMLKLYDKFGTNPDWLRRGDGPISLRALPVPQASNTYGLREPDSREIVVFSTSCNNGTQFVPNERICLPQKFAAKADMVFFYTGKGMEPLLRKNAYVGVSTEKKQPCSGEIFALLLPEDGIIFRRLSYNLENDSFDLEFIQQGYSPTSISRSKLELLIFGQIVWILQEL